MLEIDKVTKLERKLKELIPLKVEDQIKLDKKFRLEFNFNTNHIEGNTITYSETELLLIFDDAKGNHTLRELEEMKGGDVAFQLIQELASDEERPLTEQNIKYLNEILLVRPFWKDALTSDGQSTRRLIKVGEYKNHPNSVRLQNGEIFDYASPIDTPILMTELIEWFKIEEDKNELHPVVLAAMLHYKFVRIHPFDDGNGRVSRLLMNYVLFKNKLPPIVIKTADKRDYLSALNRADSGDLDSFIKYIAEQLIWSLELSIKAAKGESLDEPGDLDKKIMLLKQRLNSTDEIVKIVKSREALYDVFFGSIEPLLAQLSAKLAELDSLFKGKSERLSFDDKPLKADLEGSIFEYKQLLKSTIPYKLIYKNTFIDFRKEGYVPNLSCSFEIVFHQNVYELNSGDANFNFSKLYHEKFTESEINQVVEALGNWIVNQIEKAITGV
jgi:Fic family protein